MRRKTDNIEFVEANNIRVSLRRIAKSPLGVWRQALYHAILAADLIYNHDEKARIREALGIP